jgi:GNAT superfamily N-acetyltransferase
MSSNAIVVPASSPDHFEAFRLMVVEYFDWLFHHYEGVPGLMAAIGTHQAFEQELRDLGQMYSPPAGKALLAFSDNEPAGCAAYRDLHDGSCEMKRMYVRHRFQGYGLGRALCCALMTEAAADGFKLVRLDTGYLNSAAIAMYGQMGFRPCPPYRDYPDNVARHLVFMERPLGAPVPGWPDVNAEA